MFKKLRLLVAKWALKPDDVTAEDVNRVFDTNLGKLFEEHAQTFLSDASKKLDDSIANRTTEIAKKQVTEMLPDILKDIPAENLAAIVLQNTQLSVLQKSQLCAILMSPAGKTDYLG